MCLCVVYNSMYDSFSAAYLTAISMGLDFCKFSEASKLGD